MSDVICYSYVIRRLMSMMFVVWYQTSHVRCLISDLWYDIRYLITLIWQQLSEVSLMLYLMLYNCYQPSDVWCQTSNMMDIIWYQTSDNSYITADVWCLISDVCCHITVIRHLMLYLMLYNCYQTSDVWYQTSDIRHLTNDIGRLITVSVRCLISDVCCIKTVIRHLITVKGAVSRHSGSLSLILLITRPQSLWNLK